MEALGAVASVIAVIQIAASVLSTCNDYLSSTKHASKEAEQIVSELTSLKLVLEQVLLVAQREQQSRPGESFALAKIVTPGGELDTCKENLIELQQKLQPRDGWKALKHALTWHFKEGEFRKTLERIGKSKDTLNLAVTVDSALTSLTIQDEVTNLAASFKAATIDVGHQDALNWLAAPDASENQNSARRKYQPATGTWFISSQQFATWKTKRKSLVWLHGIRSGLWKDYTLKSTLPDMLRSLVAQLAIQSTNALAILETVYIEHEIGRRRPSLDALSGVLTDMIRLYADTYLIVDALDECRERDNLLDWVVEISELNLLNLHLLLFSRKEKDIADVLNPLVDTQIPIINTKVDPDIRLYLRNRLTGDRKLKKWPVEVQEEIEQSMMAKVNGMFRLADCQMDMLCKCNNIVALRKALQSLPKTLEDTYTRILSEIDGSHMDDALKILQCLCFSARPLLLTEMVEALAVDNVESFKFNPDLRYADHHDILTVCSSLISAHPRVIKRDPWDDKREHVEELRLAHFSVKEFLISDHLMKASFSFFHIEIGLASAVMTEICIIYLKQFREYACLSRSNISKYPLATYAAKHWSTHAKMAQKKGFSSRFSKLAADFLSDYENCRNWISLFNPDESIIIQSDLEYIDLQEPVKDKDIRKPLYYACLFGLLDVVSLLLARLTQKQDYGEIAGETGTLMHAAAYSGEIPIIDLLIKHGASVNVTGGEWGTPLGSAIEAGSEEAALALLQRGADPNISGGYYGTPLQAASYKGNYRTVVALISHGARPDRMGGSHGSALAAAAEGKHGNIVQLLLDHGVDINAQTTFCGSALYHAAGHGSLKTVQLLLEKGAYIDSESHFGETALIHAADGNHTDMIQYLLEHSANPNIASRMSGTALTIACQEGNIRAVNLLLKYHADINQSCGDYGTPLAAAASKGHADIVDTLLKHGANAKIGSVIQAAMSGKHMDIVRKLVDEGGADIHEYGGDYGYPLQSAAMHKDLQMVRFLMDNSADVNARGGTYGTALQAAITSGYNPDSFAVAKYLIEHGADVNAQCGVFGSALHAATSMDASPSMIDLLIKHNVDVNARSRDSGIALHAAIENGGTKFRKLIKAGSDIEARTEDTATPLSTAISNERPDFAKELLKLGASINSRHDEYNNLHQAASEGLTDIVSALLDKGADINGISDYHGTALQASAMRGHSETIALLLKRGADINLHKGSDGSAIHLASESESLRALKLLVEAGADVHDKRGRCHTTLQAAASAGEFKNVEYLLSLQVDVNIEGGEYGTALQAAAYSESRNIVKALLDANAKVNVPGGTYGSALQAAAQHEGNDPIVRLLLDAGADVNLAGGEYGHPLQAAAQANNLEMVKTFITLGADIDARGGEYGTALLAAASRGYVEIFSYLLGQGANVNVSGPSGTLLYYATEGGDEKIVQTVLDLGFDINSGRGTHGSSVGMAIESGSMKALKLLISRGIEVNEQCGRYSAILQAIRHVEEEDVKILLAAGVDVDVQIPSEYHWEPAEEWQVKNEDQDTSEDLMNDDDHDASELMNQNAAQNAAEDTKTDNESDDKEEFEYGTADEEEPEYHNALHEALCQDKETIKQLILSKVSNVNAPGGKYGSALQAALVHSHLGIVKQLLSRGADVHARGGEFHTAMQAAASTHELARVELLLTHDPTIDINILGGKHNTALQAASYTGSLQIVKYLLDHGALINAHRVKGSKHFTALQAACSQGHLTVIKHLLDRGADINIHSPYYGDALQAASAQGQVEAVRLLLQYNPRVDAGTCSKKYGNALQAATDGGWMKVIQMLVKHYPCFREGEMFEKAVQSLVPIGHKNMAKEMERMAKMERKVAREKGLAWSGGLFR